MLNDVSDKVVAITENSHNCKLTKSDFDFFSFIFLKYLNSFRLLYRLSKLVLRKLDGKYYPYAITCFSFDRS